jgi:hypothetical protein
VHVVLAILLSARPTADQQLGRPQEVPLGLIKMEVSSLIVRDDHVVGNVVNTLIGLPN